MASISSLYGTGSTSSIYGNRNVISGLASGLDTETLIENSIMGYKTKIQQLVGQQTKLSWKQDAYRSITDKMIAMRDKYTSYLSKTNLSSPSYFSKAVTTTPNGENSGKVSATGRSNSDVQINAITQLATAAKYSVEASDDRAATGAAMALDDIKVSNISGSMTLTVGNKTIDLSFGKNDAYESAGDLAIAINEKLKEQQVVGHGGQTVTADKMVKAVAKDGKIEFTALKHTAQLGDGSYGAAEIGDTPYISSVSGDFGKMLGIKASSKISEADKTITVPAKVDGKSPLYETQKPEDYLSNKTVKVTLDGTTKEISLGSLSGDTATNGSIEDQIVKNLKEGLKNAFGSKVDVELKDGKLEFSTSSQNSMLRVTSEVGKPLGLGASGVSNYLDTSKSIGDVLGSDFDDLEALKAVGDVTDKGDGKGVDKAGNSVQQLDDGTWVRVDSKGQQLYGLEVNGKQVGAFTRDTSLERVLSAINGSDAGVKVSYSKLTNKFAFTAADTGSEGRIEFGDGLAKSLFGDTAAAGSNYVPGQDAKLTATVNGETLEMTRSSNVIDFDGMSVTLKGTFTTGEAVTFTTKANADELVETVKGFVEEYNAIMKEVRESYSTQPAKKYGSTSTATYEPLTDEEKADMSESELKAYEEKAKQGLLFGDSDLSRLYNSLRNAISPTGDDRKAMEAIGLTTSYSDGLTTLQFDENQFREALETNPDMVQKAFTQSKENGASSDGIIARMKKTMDTYASTSIGNYGVLVRKAGTKTKSLTLLDNTLQKQMNNIDKQIDRWQQKMSDKVDYYTRQFTQLEQLMAQMNSQSSALAGLMGGY